MQTKAKDARRARTGPGTRNKVKKLLRVLTVRGQGDKAVDGDCDRHGSLAAEAAKAASTARGHRRTLRSGETPEFLAAWASWAS